MAELMGSNPVQARIFFLAAANYKVACTTAIISNSLNTLLLSITNLKAKQNTKNFMKITKEGASYQYDATGDFSAMIFFTSYVNQFTFRYIVIDN